MSVVGTIMALILFASRLQWIPDLTVPAVTINMLAMFIMRIPRIVDDFVAELWAASASITLFAMAGVAQIAIAAGERLSDAIPQVGLLEWPFLIGLLVFYATYHLKRWRGA
jgi:hypothetical protein